VCWPPLATDVSRISSSRGCDHADGGDLTADEMFEDLKKRTLPNSKVLGCEPQCSGPGGGRITPTR
jgi:hypothetical protein